MSVWGWLICWFLFSAVVAVFVGKFIRYGSGKDE